MYTPWASCLHTCASVTKQYNLVPANGRWCSAAGEVTAGLTESNGSLPPGLWLRSPAGWLPRTGISSGTPRSYRVWDYILPPNRLRIMFLIPILCPMTTRHLNVLVFLVGFNSHAWYAAELYYVALSINANILLILQFCSLSGRCFQRNRTVTWIWWNDSVYFEQYPT